MYVRDRIVLGGKLEKEKGGRASYLFRSHGHQAGRPRSQGGSGQQKCISECQGHDGGGEDDLHGEGLGMEDAARGVEDG